jgi:hypothetical protein
VPRNNTTVRGHEVEDKGCWANPLDLLLAIGGCCDTLSHFAGRDGAWVKSAVGHGLEYLGLDAGQDIIIDLLGTERAPLVIIGQVFDQQGEKTAGVFGGVLVCNGPGNLDTPGIEGFLVAFLCELAGAQLVVQLFGVEAECRGGGHGSP